MKKSLLSFVLLLSLPAAAGAQAIFETEIPFQENECWYGGAVGCGQEMPYSTLFGEFDLALQNANNQVTPLLISSRGRFIWSDRPFKFEIRERSLAIRSFHGIVEPVSAGRTLREAYMGACEKHFKPSGKIPPEIFFTSPQYNTWIELGYNQNQADIIKYAESIVSAGLPAGVLMIDDCWMKYYGSLEFDPAKFTDPRAMVDRLKAMGFRVMLWITPFVSPDSPEYRDLAARGFLLKGKSSDAPAVVRWWNGQSACYDMTNPQAKAHFIAELKRIQEEYGIDGFKFDGGDNSYYNPAHVRGYDKDATSTDHTKAWAEIGLEFPFNEYRACWQMGGQPLVQRLGDKDHSWKALASLVPQMTAAGMLGYAYACPDMVGVGQITAFAGKDASELDQRLIVRSAQIHAMMPMMQFSVAPWAVLDAENLQIVKNMVELHRKMAPYMVELAKVAAGTGEPIVRHMEYAFPGEGFLDCRDQYMLGDKYMVAPVVDANDYRDVKLPKGRWRDDTGKTYRGGTTISIKVPLNRLLYFEKI